MNSFDKLIKGNPHIKQHDWDKPKDKPNLTYEMMVQLAVVKEESILDDSVDDNISWDFTRPKEEPTFIGVDMASGKDTSVVVEWIDGHKLDQVQLEDMTDDDIKALVDTLSYDKPKKSSWYCPPDPVFTTDKDGYVYVDFDQDTMLMKDYIKKITK